MADNPLAEKAGALIETLNWIYDKVASTSAAPRPAGMDDACEQQIDRWIAIASTSAGTAGFVTGMGGLFTLPVSLPANIVGVAGIQLKLITEIAACRGYDVHSTQVRTVALACLAGDAAAKLLKDAGIRMGQQVVAQVAGAALARLNRLIGTRLLAKAGGLGMVNMAKVLPFVGGVVGGGFDALSTRAVGAIAKRVFPRVTPTPSTGLVVS